MKKIILKGRKISKGIAEGEALVSRDSISFYGGVDPKEGVIKEKDHELEGKCVTNKILVFPGSKGSSEGALKLYYMAEIGTAPKGMIAIEAEIIVAVGAILGKIPFVDKLNKNPIKIISTGDFVKVNANEGIIEINKQK